MTKKKDSVENQALLDGLSSWGLSKAEAEVYVYLIQKTGESGGSKIAIGTGLHRQYVYVALERLISLGLVEPVPFGKHKKYQARSPFEIDKITRRRSIAASDLVYELNKISAVHHDQDFEVLQGDKQIRQYEIDYVYESEEGAEEFIIGGGTTGFTKLMADHLEEYLEEKNKKKIKVQYLGNENERDQYKKYIGIFPNQEYRFMKDLPEGVTHLVIRPTSVSFFSFLTPPLVYVIKAPAVAKDYKQVFKMLWNMAS